MKISLFIPCFVDQFFPRVGLAMADVLERLGHRLDFPPDQTCCGQPAFNCGRQKEAKAVAEHTLRAFEDAELVAVPSGSCATMVKVFYRELFHGGPLADLANSMAERTYEFSQLLAERLGVTDVGARFQARATFHDGCHGLRELGIKQSPRTLLNEVQDLELVEMDEEETCCGFGGLFSVKFPQISTAMTEVKADSIAATNASVVISNDPSCLMQIQGYLDRQKRSIRSMHLAEVLASR